MADRSAEELLVHAGWLRALALRLVRDHDDADDLVQDTWVATLHRTPERSESERSWLAKVMLNRLRMRARSEGRRIAREQATLLIEEDAGIASQDVLVARAEMQRKLVELVLRLDEPYRSTVLLHYCEGVPLARIARTQGLPASTVRWRLKTALDELRAGLDAEAGGRKQWAVPLLAIPKGVLVAQKTSKVVAVAIVLLLLLVGGFWFLRSRGADGDGAARTAGAGAGGPGATAQSGGTSAAEEAFRDLPAWLIQPDVKPRRVAGRVTFNGTPVPGATVELANVATEGGLGAPLRRTTNATGEFDFGEQPAMALSVRASAPRHSSAMLGIDLRNPSVRSDKLELALGACDAAMFGTVRDASGGAIANARIARLDFDSRGDVLGGPAVVADDSGAYEMCVETRWPPRVPVEVSAEGYGTIVYVAMVPGRVKIDFALVPEATIVGRVVRDDTREPIAQAYVFVPARLPGVQGTGWRATFSDAAGRFRLDRVAPGSHRVFASADGFADSMHGVPLVLEAGHTSADIEIRLEAGSMIRGRVVDGGKPVAGARVAVHRRSAYSQDDGSFVLTAVPRGEVVFSALPYDVTKPKRFQVTEPVHEGVVLEVEPLGTITGLVVRGRNPVPGAALYLRGPNEHELGSVFTDADGRFTARGLRAGPWNVGAGSQKLGAFGFKPEVVQLARGETKEVTIDMAYAAAISGRVIDQNGAPVPGVSVGFVHTAANDIGVGVTDMNGNFRAATMTGGGQYRPTVSLTPSATPAKIPLRPASGTEFPLITLADGSSEVTGVVLAVRLERQSISGTVVDGAGAPIPDVRVVAELVEDNIEPVFFRALQLPASTTDVDGRFTIDDLIDGTYALHAHAPAGLDATQVGVRAGKRDVTLVLPSPGAIEATVTGFAAPPQVGAQPADRVSSGPVRATVEGNVASIRNLAPGRYIVTAQTPTEGASAIVEVTGQRTTRVTLASKGSSVVAGRVREFRSGKPIEGMMCRAVPRIGTSMTAVPLTEGVRADAHGAFVLDAPAGDIAIWCDGLWPLYSDGLRRVTLSPGQRLDLDVPVVGWNDGVTQVLAGLGADFDHRALVPTFVRVKPGGPVASAGFANGDVVTAVDGTSVDVLSPNGVWTLLLNRTPGTKVKLTVARAGRTLTGEVTLGPTH